MDIKDLDVEYYKTVWETQNDPEILKSELKDLINDCLRIKTDGGAEVPCNVGLVDLHEQMQAKESEHKSLMEYYKNKDDYQNASNEQIKWLDFNYFAKKLDGLIGN